MASGIKKIAEQARRILGQRDSDSDIDKRELELSVRQSMSYIVRKRIYESKMDDILQIPDSLVKGFKNVSIELDEDLNMLYSNVPADVLDLPYGLGIKLVAPQKDIKCAFYRMANGFESMSCGLESGCIPGKDFFFEEGSRIYYPYLEHENRPDKMYIRLVSPAESIDNEDLEVPGDMELDILSKVLEFYGIFKPQDEINDQNDIA